MSRKMEENTKPVLPTKSPIPLEPNSRNTTKIGNTSSSLSRSPLLSTVAKSPNVIRRQTDDDVDFNPAALTSVNSRKS